jgi:hypothetical protein
MEVIYEIQDIDATFEVIPQNSPDKDYIWDRNPENEPDSLIYTLKFIPTPFEELDGITIEEYNSWIESCEDQIDSDNCDSDLDDMIQEEYFK